MKLRLRTFFVQVVTFIYVNTRFFKLPTTVEVIILFACVSDAPWQ
jgi:hypothetical protein